MRVVNRANTQAEAEGLIFGFQEMRKKGYQLENVSLHYRGNQGLDMIFRSSNGPPVIYAVVEAKSAATMGAVKTSENGLRQGSREYNLDRLKNYLKSSDLAHEEIARMLQAEAKAGRLLSFITLKRSGRIVEVNDDE